VVAAQAASAEADNTGTGSDTRSARTCARTRGARSGSGSDSGVTGPRARACPDSGVTPG
jgi:hypothetical protein